MPEGRACGGGDAAGGGGGSGEIGWSGERLEGRERGAVARVPVFRE